MLNNCIAERWSPAPPEMKGTVRGIKRRPVRHADVSVDRDHSNVPAPVSEPVCSSVSSEGRDPEPDRTRERLLWAHWTQAEEQTLRQCYEEGTPIKEISKWLGMPVRAVYSKAHRMGLTEGRAGGKVGGGTRWTPEDIRILIEGAHRNLTCTEISDMLSAPRTQMQIISQLRNLRKKGYDIPQRTRKGKVFRRRG